MRLTLRVPQQTSPTRPSPLVTQEHLQAQLLASLSSRLSRSRDNFTSPTPLVIVVKGMVLP